MLKWEKASYGKSVTKSGGAKLESVANGGDKGIPKGGTYPGKASVGRTGNGGIDAPGLKGNKGVTTDKGFPKSPAKFD